MSNATLVKPGEAYLQPVVDVQQSESLPYVTFAFKMADKWDDMASQIKGLQEATPVLNNNGEFERLSPFKFHLVEARQLWVERERGRDPLSVLTSRPSNWKVPQKEEIHCVVLAYTSQGIVPATVTFKKAMCKGAAKAASELRTVAGRDPELLSEWLAKSEDHRAAGGIGVPFARFTASVTTQMRPPKGDGEPYPESIASLSPTTVGDWNQLQDFLADGGYEKLDAVMAVHKSRIEDLLKLEVTR